MLLSPRSMPQRCRWQQRCRSGPVELFNSVQRRSTAGLNTKKLFNWVQLLCNPYCLGWANGVFSEVMDRQRSVSLFQLEIWNVTRCGILSFDNGLRQLGVALWVWVIDSHASV